MTIMMAITIKVARVMPMQDMPGTVRADVVVQIPGLNARVVIEMAFPAPAGSNRADWTEIAYENVLLMLDPA